jgi:hypothetical protein
MWYLSTVAFYSAIKKSKLLSFEGKWMKLEIIMLSEIRETQKGKYHVFFLM